MATLVNKMNREVKVIIPNMREFRVFYSDNEGSVMFFKRDWREEKQEESWKPSEPEKGALQTAIYVLREENFPKAAEHLQDILNAFEQMSDYKVGDKLSWEGKEYTIDKVVCGGDPFETIGKAKRAILEATNIADSPKEMAVLDSFLFRCWQMGWLKKYEDNANEDNT